MVATVSIPERVLQDKVAVVTGGSRGLGKAMAEGLARAGADVVVVSRHLEACQAVAEELRRYGGRHQALAADVSRVAEADRLMYQVRSARGRVDILVNNAGISPIFKRAETVTENEWDDIIDTNLKGAFFCAAAAGRAMIDQKSGSIINISSAVGEEGAARLSVYAVAKAGVISLTKTLAVEWAQHNIRVNCIAPAYFDVGVSEPALNTKWVYEEIIRRTPMKRVGLASELMGAVVFLASNASSYVTGHTLYVDGGWHAA